MSFNKLSSGGVNAPPSPIQLEWAMAGFSPTPLPREIIYDLRNGFLENEALVTAQEIQNVVNDLTYSPFTTPAPSPQIARQGKEEDIPPMNLGQSKAVQYPSQIEDCQIVLKPNGGFSVSRPQAEALDNVNTGFEGLLINDYYLNNLGGGISIQFLSAGIKQMIEGGHRKFKISVSPRYFNEHKADLSKLERFAEQHSRRIEFVRIPDEYGVQIFLFCEGFNPK